MVFLCCLGEFTAPYRAAPQSGSPSGMATSWGMVWEVHSTQERGGLIWEKPVQGGKEQIKGSLVSYDTVSSVLAEQQIGILEGNPTAVQTKGKVEIYLPSSITDELCLS